MPIPFQSKPAAGSLQPRLKARDKVLRLLEDYCQEQALTAGDLLPSSRVVASHVGVSLTTVQNVYRQLAAEGIIRVEPGSGCYLETPFPSQQKQTLRIGLSFGMGAQQPASGPWSMAISGAIMRSASQVLRPLSIHPVAVPNQPTGAVLDALQAWQGKVDVMILHPVLEGSEVAARQADLTYPIVYLNPGFTTALTNFVSADYYGISRQLGEAWAASGRHRILFVHNSGAHMNAAAALRCAGLVAGLGNRLGNGIDLRIVTGDEMTEEAGYALAESVLGDIVDASLPDAIYVVGDTLGGGICRYLEDRDIMIPEAVSVVAGSGFSQLPVRWAGLTRTCQPVEKIGASLLEMACTLADSEQAEVPGRFYPCHFIGGGTTRTEENRVLPVA